MLRARNAANRSDKVAIKMRHDKDTIYVDPDTFEVNGESFTLEKAFEFKVKMHGQRRMLMGYVARSEVGETCIHVEENVAKDPPTPTPLTQKEIDAGKRQPFKNKRLLTPAEHFAGCNEGQQPPNDGILVTRAGRKNVQMAKGLAGHQLHYCLFRCAVPPGTVDLEQLEVEVWTAVEGGVQSVLSNVQKQLTQPKPKPKKDLLMEIRRESHKRRKAVAIEKSAAHVARLAHIEAARSARKDKPGYTKLREVYIKKEKDEEKQP